MIKLAFAVFTCTLFVSCSNSSPNSSSYWPSAAELEQYNSVVSYPDQITCRQERGMGSRISHRTCYRMSDLQNRNKATRKLVENIQASSQLYSIDSF